jgi:capsule polysaccharide export protein KpsE/RkpR
MLNYITNSIGKSFCWRTKENKVSKFPRRVLERFGRLHYLLIKEDIIEMDMDISSSIKLEDSENSEFETIDSKLTKAKSDMSDANIELNKTKSELESAETSLEKAIANLDRAESNVVESKANLAKAKLNLELAEETYGLNSNEFKIAQTKCDDELGKNDIASSRLKRAQEMYDIAKTKRSRLQSLVDAWMDRIRFLVSLINEMEMPKTRIRKGSSLNIIIRSRYI